MAFVLAQRQRKRIAAALEAAARAPESLRQLPARLLEEVCASSATNSDAAKAAARVLVEGPSGDRLRVRAARGRSWWRRAAALQTLLLADDGEALPLLREAVFSGDPELARSAVALLGEAGSAEAAEILIEALVRDAYPSSRIATALERKHVRVASRLRPLLTTDSPRLRYWATLLLARYPDEPGLDRDLASLTRDADPTIRKAAIQSLATLKSPLAATEASRLLADPVDFVRTHAALARAAGGPHG